MARVPAGPAAKTVPPSATAADPPIEAPRHEPEPGGLQYASDVRLLIVDDDDQICRLMAAALAGEHLEIDTVSNPARMEAKIRSRPYHIILLDYVIPNLDPEQVLGWVREAQPDASIIVVTGFPSMDSAVQCLRAGTFDYLTKPFQMSHLQQVVRRCLESKGLLRMSEETLRESLGAVIRERRKALGLTLAQLSERSGVSLGYLSQIELGKNSASVETLYRITLGLRVKMSELFQAVQAPGQRTRAEEE
jgi:DNA-binding response OmpR family regulator